MNIITIYSAIVFTFNHFSNVYLKNIGKWSNYDPPNIEYQFRRSNKKDTSTNFHLKVGIVGAGISGLYAALLLQDLGIQYEILEATNRIGGRFYTYYFDSKFDYSYVELGAMRFPDTPVYNRLIGKQNWSLVSYLNSRLNASKKLKLIKFISESENNIFYFNGKRRYLTRVKIGGDLFGFNKYENFLNTKYFSENVFFWNRKAIDYIEEKVNSNTSKWFRFLLKNDYQNFRGFLMDPSNNELSYPFNLVDYIEDIFMLTGAYSLSFMDVYLDETMARKAMVTIEGGVSKLIDSVNSLLHRKPKLKKIVQRIKQQRNNNILVETKDGQFNYTHLLLTPTFRVLRDIDFQCEISLKKKVAMRTIPYGSAVKIGIQFITRFWENSTIMNGKPIYGGYSNTDLRIRSVYYPSYGINCINCFGVLLVYTLYRDAEKFNAFSNNELIEICLEDLSTIHGQIVYAQFTGNYKIMNWSKYKWTQGAFGAFEPGYYGSYYSHLIQPEAKGRLHFVGETVSLYHSWSIGSLVSVYRALRNIFQSQGMYDKIKQLEFSWANVDEPNIKNTKR